jgi:hypothetical protein
MTSDKHSAIPTRGVMVGGTVLLSLFFLSLWCLDLSVTALLNGLVLTNGFMVANPAVMYHVALGIVILSFIGMTFMAIEAFYA